jgi:Flp pilus assembly pilin Flp
MERIRHFLEDESGSIAVEYGLIGVLIGLACIAVITMLGIDLAAVFKTFANAKSGGERF